MNADLSPAWADLECPSVDVCGWCADVYCDGIACIANLNPDDPGDHEAIETLHDYLRRGRLAMQMEQRLAVAEGRKPRRDA